MIDLEPIKRRLAAIPPYPWRTTRLGTVPDTFPGVVTVEEDGDWSPVAWNTHEFEETAHNLDLIANAPTDLTALVVEVERLRNEIAGLAGAFQSQQRDLNDMRAERDDARRLVNQPNGTAG